MSAGWIVHDTPGLEPTRTERVCEGVVRVPLVTATLPPATRTNVYIVRGQSAAWVVDPGTSDAAECAKLEAALAEALDDWGVPLGGVLLTHHHPDHVDGLPAWLTAHATPIYATAVTIDLVEDAHPSLDVPWHVVEANTDEPATLDGLLLPFTPGHAPGHVAVWTGEGHEGLAPGVLIAGDLIAGFGTIVVGPPRGNMSDYIASLERAAALEPKAVFPSHGPGSTDGGARLIATRDHRLAREAKILSRVDAADPRSVEEITALAYDDVDPSLHMFAMASVIAHLHKLLDDGRVREHDGGYTRA